MPRRCFGVVFVLAFAGALALGAERHAAGRQPAGQSNITVPFVLDHNRMVLDAEMRASDGTWHPARLWVDTGNPDLAIRDAYARELHLDLASAPAIRIGGMPLKTDGLKPKTDFPPRYWATMHGDANLPSTILGRYQVVFDYPARRMTLAEPGTVPHRGARVSAAINRATGIAQIDVVVDRQPASLALDIGASYSFVSSEVFDKWVQPHPKWPRLTGAVGCANIWGMWPQEAKWPVVRVPEIQAGTVRLEEVGVVGLPNFFPNGQTLATWYSQKTANPVAGILGPNAIKAFRFEIDYAGSAVYLERTGSSDAHDMDLVGLTVQPRVEGGYSVVGVAIKDGKPVVEGVEPGDVLLEVAGVKVDGATMGTVVDALRGRPGETRTLVLDRNGARITVKATVRRLL